MVETDTVTVGQYYADMRVVVECSFFPSVPSLPLTVRLVEP